MINADLINLSKGNEEYAYFSKKIVNTNKTVLGVRTPDMRKLAKRLAKQVTAADVREYLDSLDKTVFEHVMVGGMIINYAPLTDREVINLTKQYLKLVDSWAEIDSFVMKRKKFDEKLRWEFALQSLGSKNEFTVRFGVIEMMSNYLNDKYINTVFSALRDVTHEGYYVRIGMAWLYASAAINFYKLTLNEIKTAKLKPWTKKKALTKMLESSQFSPEQKAEIRTNRGQLEVIA